MRRLGTMGKTIVVSSHILPELADVCNKIGIIDKGELKVSAEVTEVMKQVREKTVLFVDVVSDKPGAAKLLRDQEIVESVDMGDGHLVVTLNQRIEDFSALASELVKAGFGISQFQEEEVSLESAFMALTKGAGSKICLLYTSPSPRDRQKSRMPSSA